jgi:2-methylcitrate dehydratase PrpD
VEVSGDAEMSMRAAPDRPVARVAIELGDGRVVTREAAVVYGDSANPRPRLELEAKFLALASGTLDATGAREVIGMAARLDQLADMRALTGLLSPGAPR